MTFWQIVLLAVVQGITEFLPVSSSGHLVIVASLLAEKNQSLENVSDVNIVLHIGTLLSILVFYFQRVRRLIGEDRRTIKLLIVGTIPAVAVGLPVKLLFDDVLENALLAGCLLIVTGIILFLVARCRPGNKEYQTMHLRGALLIGISQAAAILPGLSRSGATISAGLFVGLNPRAAATFSFLLAIPVIAGAGLLEVVHLAADGSVMTPIGYLLFGVLIAFIVGLAALTWLVRWLERGRLQWFAFWCIPIGIAVVIWQLFGNS